MCMPQVLVPLATVFLCYLALAYGFDGNNLPSIIAPLILVFILSYFIACMFRYAYTSVMYIPYMYIYSSQPMG